MCSKLMSVLFVSFIKLNCCALQAGSFIYVFDVSNYHWYSYAYENSMSPFCLKKSRNSPNQRLCEKCNCLGNIAALFKTSKICRRLKFTGIQIASGLALVFDVLKIIIATSERNSAECRPSDCILVKES